MTMAFAAGTARRHLQVLVKGTKLCLTNVGCRRRSSSIRIGCASGFWGDTPTAVPQLLQADDVKLDYLMFDYLSELTMSLLTAAQQKDPRMGYAPDFVAHAVAPHLRDIKRKGVKIISNAGGINTSACVAALTQACKKADVDLKIAYVSGDNMMHFKDELKGLPKGVHSMTAYFGAGPIVKALEMGADVVVTGRTADSALALAPCVHEFGWKADDLDLLATASLAGHLIECGGQATGGLFTDWTDVSGYENLGFPVVEVRRDGDAFRVMKPADTGGLLNRHTVAEQLLYEIADPSAYVLPDVVCDFANVQIDDLPDGSVEVSGAKGKPATADYKVCATYLDGYRGTCAAVVAGGRAAAKGRKVADALLARANRLLRQRGLDEFDKTYTSVIGSEDSFGRAAFDHSSLREAVIWMAVRHGRKEAVELWAREIASSGTGMAPGLCGMIGGRPKATPCLRLFSFLHPKSRLPATVTLGDRTATYPFPEQQKEAEVVAPSVVKPSSSCCSGGEETYFLEQLAFARSGDKGDQCNVGVIARHPAFLPYIERALTPEAVANYFSHFFEDDDGNADVGGDWSSYVESYRLPGINAINLVLKNSLGGGGMASLRPDPLGKSFGQRLLSFELNNMPTLATIIDKYEQQDGRN